MDPDGNSGGTAEGGEGEGGEGGEGGGGGGGAGWCCAYMYVIYTSGTFPNEVLPPDPLLLCTPRDENQLEQNKLYRGPNLTLSELVMMPVVRGDSLQMG